MEGGRRVERQTQRQDWIANLQRFRADRLQVSLPELPSLTDLEAAYRRVQPSKATGSDLVDAGLCHCDPASFAKKTYALLLKLFYMAKKVFSTKAAGFTPCGNRKVPEMFAVHTAASSSPRTSESLFIDACGRILRTFLRNFFRNNH